MSFDVIDGWIDGALPGPSGRMYRVERKPIAGGQRHPVPVRAAGLHGTDGYDVDSAYEHQKASGFGVHFYTGEHRIIQSRSLLTTAGGFRNNPEDPGDPNAEGFIQIEHVQRYGPPDGVGLRLHLPAEPSLFPLVAVARFLNERMDIPYTRPAGWPDDLRTDDPQTDNGAWAARNYRRRSGLWKTFRGWIQHLEVDYQGPTWHYDSASFWFERFFELCKEEDDMDGTDLVKGIRLARRREPLPADASAAMKQGYWLVEELREARTLPEPGVPGPHDHPEYDPSRHKHPTGIGVPAE